MLWLKLLLMHIFSDNQDDDREIKFLLKKKKKAFVCQSTQIRLKLKY